MFQCNTICTENGNNNNNDNGLKDEMELRMERNGQQVTLRLKKNDNVRDDVPVYTSKDKVDTKEMPVSIYCHIIFTTIQSL